MFVDIKGRICFILAYAKNQKSSLTESEKYRIAAAVRQLRAIRAKLQMSQRVFASALNVSDRTVQAWERGARRPDGSALRLLEIADEHPAVLTATIGTWPGAC